MAAHASADKAEKNENGSESNTLKGKCPLDSENLPIIEFKNSPYTLFVKPCIDRFTALVALIALAVPLFVIAALIAKYMGTPIFFRQQRMGLNGKVFEVLKFRTMGHDRRQTRESVSSDQRVTHKSEKDPRHTSLGRFLRRYSLDELPQLINVLRGEMSLIGPRPELVSVVEQYYSEELHQRHFVKPGLTGLWQVSARGEGLMYQNGGWDIVYVQTISPLTDLVILLKTPLVMFSSQAGE